MAIYHLNAKVVSRSKGRSSVQLSAYISGDRIIDERLNKTFNHTDKQEVIYSQVLLPKHAPKEFLDHSVLWNSVERNEKTNDSQLARHFNIALPSEWSEGQMIQFSTEFVNNSLVSRGMCAEVAIHFNESNPHLHILTTMREIDQKGNWMAKEKKAYKLDENGEKIPVIDPKTGAQKIGAKGRREWQREYVERNGWNNKEFIKDLRQEWQDFANARLDQNHQIDHRSYQEQGLDRISLNLEQYDIELAKRGIYTYKFNQIEHIKSLNSQIDHFKADMEQLNKITPIKQEIDPIAQIRAKIDQIRHDIEYWQNAEPLIEKYQNAKKEVKEHQKTLERLKEHKILNASKIKKQESILEVAIDLVKQLFKAIANYFNIPNLTPKELPILIQDQRSKYEHNMTRYMNLNEQYMSLIMPVGQKKELTLRQRMNIAKKQGVQIRAEHQIEHEKNHKIKKQSL